MPKIHKSISISAPVENVFEYVTDPTKLPEWFVGLSEVTDVTGSGVGQHNRWTYSMIGMPSHGESEIIEHVPNERSVSKQEGGMTSTIIFTFAPQEGGTKLDFDVDYTIPIPVLGKLAEKVVFKRNQREAELSMENLKQRLEV